jgi:RNA polymerase subunit RPABC4/transcription elongation factor Spt4
MFFFIAGVQPRTKTLEGEARACPACGRISLRRRRVDHVLSLFFIPLFPVKRGAPFLACGNCGAIFDEDGCRWTQGPSPGAGICRFCGRMLDRDFSYCPYCGTPRKP